MRQRSAEQRRPPVQRKLTVGPADDRYEREADAMAKQVMSHLAAPAPAGDVARSSIEEEELMMQRAQRQSIEDEELAMKRVQRDVLDPVAPLSARDVQREAIGAEGGDVDAATTARIEASRGGGSELDRTLRRSMEGAFGADFSSVRVHTGARSDALNATLGARAFTTGADVFVRSSDYRPNSPGGRELLAHELTHVVQQGAARSLDPE